MANWKYNLKLHDLREQCDNEEITISEFGKKVAERIKKLRCYKTDDELQEIADNFEYIEDEDDFNNILNSLYDWGDTIIGEPKGIMQNKLCWIGFAF